MSVDKALRVDAFAVGVAVGVVADEAGVEDVGQLGRQGGDAAGGTDGGSALVGVVVPDGRAVATGQKVALRPGLPLPGARNQALSYGSCCEGAG